MESYDYKMPASLDIAKLPVPHIKGKEFLRELCSFTWQSAFNSIHYKQELPSPYYMYNALHPNYIWVWDTCFMALYTRYLPDIFPGIQSLDNFYGFQRSDGYISMTYVLETGKEAYGERINPPLFGWAEWEYYRTTGRSHRIRRILPHLIKHFEWIFSNRRTADELFYFEDAGSSGMDNSPRGQRNPDAGKHLGWIDLSSQMALLAISISRLAEAIGEKGIASRFKAQHEYISRWTKRHCWCPRSRFFHDYMPFYNWLASKTAAGFWPMVAEFAEKEQVDAMCEHLKSPQTFGRPCPVPTLSFDDPNYTEQGDYWLGGVWAPTNYMIFSGLKKYRRYKLARELALRYLEHIAKVYYEYTPHPKTLWECYSPEKPEPSKDSRHNGRLVQPDFTGWTALGPTAMLYEFILGLDIDVPQNTLTWELGLTSAYEMQNMPFGDGGVMNLRCAARDKEEDPAHIELEANIDFTLHLIKNGKEEKIAVKKGVPLKKEV